MTEARRVLHLLPTLSQGGAELYVYRLAKLQAEEPGDFSSIVCSFLRRGPVEDLLQNAGIPTHCLDLPRRPARLPWQAWADFRRITQAVTGLAREQGVDSIQTHLSDSDWIGMQVGRELQIPVALTFHSSKLVPPERSPNEFRSRFRSALQSRFYKKAQALIAVGQDVQQSLLQFPGVRPENVHLVPSAIEIPLGSQEERIARAQRAHPDLAQQATNENSVLVTVGRLVPSKGHDRLIRMMPAILEAHPGASLWIIGEGPERAHLDDLVESMQLSSRVQLLGGRSDVEDILPLAQVFVTGTKREGLGLAVAEGMAAFLPTVGFSVPGIVDTIQDGKNGSLAPDGDETAFIQAVTSLLSDPNLRAAWGAEARQSSLAFDVRASRQKTDAIHASLCGDD